MSAFCFVAVMSYSGVPKAVARGGPTKCGESTITAAWSCLQASQEAIELLRNI